jgi:hypothetical protein
MPPTLANDLRAAKQWRQQRARRRKASPGYAAWFPLARALHTDPADPWPVLDIARYLKTEHAEAKKHLAHASLSALHRALCRHLNPK